MADRSDTTALVVPGTDAQPLSRNIIKEIAMDIGRAVVAYVEVQYPNAITATSSTFKLSLRNTVYNEIMAALETVDEGAIKARLAERKKFRRQWKAAYRNIRDQPITEDVIHDV